MTSLRQAVKDFLLACKAEGKSVATVHSYSLKLRAFVWYATASDWPRDIGQVTPARIREFLTYLRETEHRFDSECPRAMRPVCPATIRNYYGVLSSMFGWLQREGVLDVNPMSKVRPPKPERKVIHALTAAEVTRLVASFGDTFEATRDKAIVLIMVDCGVRIGECINLQVSDVDMDVQTLSVSGKTGQRVVRFGSTAGAALKAYIEKRPEANGCKALWTVREGTGLKASSLETAFRHLARRTGLPLHPHLLRHSFATLWLKAGGGAIQLQRLLGHTSLGMTSRYVQAVDCSDARESHKLYSPGDNLGGNR